MCGIAGVMRTSDARTEDSVLQLLGDALAHRGPDGRGTYHADRVAMVQTRLAIIDLATGDQPLYGPEHTALIGNGEIYNYVELRQQLGEDRFATRSDCEPPLHLYAAHGLGFAEHLRGMYALAIHDRTSGRLVLSRDPFGIKPLYYIEHRDHFAFASEPQALIAAGLAERVEEPLARAELLQMQFSTGASTPFHGIKRLLPGETVIVAGGRILERTRRTVLPTDGPRAQDVDAALADLDCVLMDSVMVHQRADVPYGMFLSGGTDSSALLAVMARLNERPVQAYTAGFRGADVHDERDRARRVAHAAGAEHIEVEIGEEDVWRTLPRIAAAMDDPVADYAVIPTYLLAERARQDVKVILCGEGGDELFAGYGRYRSAVRPWFWGGRGMRVKGMFDDLDVLREQPLGWRDGMDAAETQAAGHGKLTRLQVAQMIDCSDWLPNDLLTKVDRCLMAHGVEGRVPLLDPAVADFAFSLPDRLKVHGRLGKWLLRKWLETALPEADAFGRKRGFTVPVAQWLRSQGARLGPLVAAQSGVAALCHRDRVVRLFGSDDKRHGFAAWTLLFYALWHQRHIIGRDPGDADTFAALDAARADR
ncbi:MAG: asparagine synthase (glutamine-hydrolyzing) [Alphaproteobacteria bacterium]